MRYRILIQVEEDDHSDKYEITIVRECFDAAIADELLSAACAGAERILRAMPETEATREVG